MTFALFSFNCRSISSKSHSLNSPLEYEHSVESADIPEKTPPLPIVAVNIVRFSTQLGTMDAATSPLRNPLEIY